MSWRTSSITLRARNAARAIGLNRMLARLGRKGYEIAYDELLSSRIRQGDLVWDIGANVGYYTVQFAKFVGRSGRVIAFESSAQNFNRMRRACIGLENVSLQPYGLGNVSGELRFKCGSDELGATSRVVNDDSADAIVQILVGDELVSGATVPQLNVIKMDVEGFEGEVLEGLANQLKRPSLHTLGIKVHFGILNERGLKHSPATIEKMLIAAGYTLRWPDASHLLASR